MAPAPPSSAGKIREGLRVLVIDDDEDLCELTADDLTPLGFRVEAVHTGERGVERALSEAWHAVILDFMLLTLLSLMMIELLAVVVAVVVFVRRGI